MPLTTHTPEIKLGDGSLASVGDRVLVTSGLYAGREGAVKLIISSQTECGPYEVVWVELAEGVEGFKPEALAKAEP